MMRPITISPNTATLQVLALTAITMLCRKGSPEQFVALCLELAWCIAAVRAGAFGATVRSWR